MTVTVYKSTDASAPVLTGQAGALITVLDAILVNGYGAKASQGWTKPYTGTNSADYLMPSGTNQRYLEVQDNAVGSAAYARVLGYEAMSAFGTGTGPFPSVAQAATGLYIHKSSTADGTARPWYAIGNGVFFYFFTFSNGTSLGTTGLTNGGFMFGDFLSYTPGDTFNTLLIAASTTSATQAVSASHQLAQELASSAGLAGHYICRSYSGIGGSVAAGKLTNYALALLSASAIVTASGIGNFTLNLGGGGVTSGSTYPNGADSGLYMERLWLHEAAGSIRGEIPGLWCPLSHLPLVHLDTFTGSGALTGKSFEVLYFGSGAGSSQVFIETSNTW